MTRRIRIDRREKPRDIGRECFEIYHRAMNRMMRQKAKGEYPETKAKP